MSEYTKEPWSLDKYENILAGEDVLLLGGIRTPMTAGPSMDEARANARRIVACVNACAGLETEVLDNIVTLGETLLDRFELRNRQEKEIKAQRDELLSALEAAIACGMVPTSSAKEGGAMHYVRQAHVADQIRAAIAKAKGV